MIITEMEHFQSVCKKKLVEWYNTNEKSPCVQNNQPDIDPVQCICCMEL